MLTLKPRNYKQNMQLSLLPKNKIDTVTLSPISNEVTPSDIFYTEDIGTVTINGNTITLPTDVNDATNIATILGLTNTQYHAQCNDRAGALDTYRLCKSGVQCVMVSGESTVHMSSAILGNIQASINLSGFSFAIKRGTSNFNSFPDFTNVMMDTSGALSQWIHDNVNETRTYLSGDYENLNLTMNGWIKNIKAVTDTDDALVAATTINETTENDIATTWFKNISGGGIFDIELTALASGWKDYAFQLQEQDVPYTRMLPANYDPATELTTGMGAGIRFKNLSIRVDAQVTKLSDFDFKIKWQAPIRYTYAATSRTYHALFGYRDLDNYAFVDLVSNIQVRLQGTPLNIDQTDVTYSLTSTDELTTTVVGQHPFKFDTNECITLQSVIKPLETPFNRLIRVGGELSSYDGYSRQEIFALDGNLAIGNVIAYQGEYAEIDEYDSEDDYYVALILSDGPIKAAEQTEILVKVYPLDNSQNWIEYISKALLLKYRKGKYIVKVDVYAAWIIQNNVTINTQMQIQLQNSDFITRENTICTFEVKTIEKHFNANEFVYTLQLMEV